MDAAQAFHMLVCRMSTGVVVWQYDEAIASLRLVCANAAASRYAGVDLASKIGQPIREIIPDVNEDRHERYVSLARSSNMGQTLIRFEDTRTDKTTFSIRALPMPEACVGIIFQDLADEAGLLAEREKRFRFLLENSLEAISVTDEAGRHLYTSPSIVKILGYTSEEMLATPGLLLIHPDDQAHAAAVFRDIMARPGEPIPYQVRARHADGSWRELQVVTVNRLSDPSVRGLVHNFRDVSEKHETEKALRRAEEQLRQAQKMEAIGHLAGGIAHDFNNLLSVVLSYSDMLLLDQKAEDARSELLEIKRAGERAAELTRQLLAFSRKQMLKLQVVDLNQTVTSVARLLQRVLGEDLTLQLRLADELWPATLDPAQLEQVLVNLVANARDAMPTGGTVTVQTKNAVLTEFFVASHPSAKPGPHVSLMVKDTGVGIEPSVRLRIFEPFFTTKERTKGTGLGLSVVLGIVQQCGGFIDVESTPGHGAAFTLYFPRCEAGRVAQPHDANAGSEVRGGAETILVVEDDISVRDVVVSVLSRLGYQVLVAPSAQEAGELAARTDRLDLLITDVVMPGVSGPQVASQLTQLRPSLRVLFISGYADHAAVTDALAQDGFGFLQKPVTPKVLADAVRNLLDRKDRSTKAV
ncbi:MAG TPA: PAS domain S-box protein [Polyangiaceae bacterium]|nr:PAS domain S-box protein [Polyangiaceae bacterium]